MKKSILSALIVCASAAIFKTAMAQQWTPVSQEQAEYNVLTQECLRIIERYTAMGAGRSSAAAGAIFAYLKNVGTPVSLRVLRDQVAAGRVPASYLNMI